jgi:hypothetical protein
VPPVGRSPAVTLSFHASSTLLSLPSTKWFLCASRSPPPARLPLQIGSLRSRQNWRVQLRHGFERSTLGRSSATIVELEKQMPAISSSPRQARTFAVARDAEEARVDLQQRGKGPEEER